jgi:hypothetical protein
LYIEIARQIQRLKEGAPDDADLIRRVQYGREEGRYDENAEALSSRFMEGLHWLVHTWLGRFRSRAVQRGVVRSGRFIRQHLSRY